jgi:hypothetical protein
MRIQSLKHAVALTQKGVGPLTEICKGAVEVGFIVPSILKRVWKMPDTLCNTFRPGMNQKSTKQRKSCIGQACIARLKGPNPQLSRMVCRIPYKMRCCKPSTRR